MRRFKNGFKVESFSSFRKKLPISEKDLSIINSISNKVDGFDGKVIDFKTDIRSKFQDIELEFIKYHSDKNLKFEIINGKYEIVTTDMNTVIKIYNSDKGLLYTEIHKCNGT